MSELAMVADIGGTNTRVALARHGIVDAASVRRYANADARGLADHLRRYLAETGTSATAITGACVAGAGPVRDEVVSLTNLDWQVGPTTLADVLPAARVAVLNDLQAQGHALGQIDGDQIVPVVAGPQVPSAPRLVVGVGTGFNAAPVYDTESGRLVMPSEAGHVSLPYAGPGSDKVQAYLRAEYGFAAVEEALSGRGIGHVYTALHGEARDATEVTAALARGDDKAAQSIALTVRLLGSVVGDLALTMLPFGGIFLVGGVCRILAPHLGTNGFADAMRAKGRFGPFLEQFAVHLITDDFAALTGCAAHLARLR